MKTSPMLAALAACLLAAAPCAAGPGAAPVVAADSVGTLYSLITPPSAYEVGCFGPCDCAVATTPTYGSFTLVHTGRDPLFDYYAVKNYIASFNNGPGAVSIVGSGQYKIGGEFALTEELTLDLSIWGAPPQHFDSGMRPVGSTPFPKINLDCAAHGFACYDTVVVVDAAPVNVTGVPPGPGPAVRLEFAQPNPFAGQARIAFTLAQAARVDLSILDLAGRHVRTLASGELMGPGEQVATWDGRSDEGRTARAGVYWALLRSPGGADRLRLVKIN
jgi:hypothetical protein